MNSILHFHAKMRPKTDFSFTLSEWRNPDYVSHGHKALILLLRSAPCSMQQREGGCSRRHRWSEVSACFWSARLSVKGSDEFLPAGAPLLLSTCTIPSTSLNSTSPPCFLSLLIRFLKGLHSHFVCPLWGKGFAFALFHCCKINQNVCEI